MSFRAALPLADQRRELPATALFLAGSAVAALTAGFTLGSWLLLNNALAVPLPAGARAALVQLHGHVQLVGFAGLLIMGIGYRVFPRFRGAPAPSPRLVVTSFGLIAAGLASRSALAWPVGDERAIALAMSGMLQLAGALIYARVAVGTLVSGDNDHRPDELLLGLGAVWYVVGSLWTVVALGPAVAGAPAGDPVGDAVAVTALLLGFVTSTIFGVALRVARSFIAAPAAPARAVLGGTAAWYVGLVLVPLSSALASVALLAGGLVLTWCVGAFRKSAALQPLPAPALVTRLGLRVGFAWLIGGLLLSCVAALDAWPLGAPLTAARHALALGFLMSVVFAVGARLIPALTGGTPLPLAHVRGALALTSSAAALRVAYELAGGGAPGAPVALAASGAVAYGALLLYAVAAARSVRSAVSAFA